MKPRALEIRLIDQRVGWLVEGGGRYSVRFNRTWREHPARRVFSLSVEASGLEDIRATPHLPAWFENLLFEGELRRWIVASETALGQHDLSLLERIGQDLVGAVTLHAVHDEIPEVAPLEALEPTRRAPLGGIRWSLAGVQLKLNLVARGDHFCLPVHGEPGHFIAKFPDQRYPGVPVNEHATMGWARAAGMNVAETRLIDASAIDELPPGLLRCAEPVLLVKRFDRDQGRRVHAEEFAQALGLRPTEKYQRLGWRHHLRLIAGVASGDVAEYLRRLLFVIASGNGDAHHKNWSFIFPDGRRPTLSPAYDQVAVVAWTDHDPILEDSLPFKLGGSRRWEDLRLGSVLRLLEEAGISTFADGGTAIEPSGFERWIREQIARIRDALPAALHTAAPGYQRAVEAHWARTPLMKS